VSASGDENNQIAISPNCVDDSSSMTFKRELVALPTGALAVFDQVSPNCLAWNRSGAASKRL
jgi:hypothetical protein